MSDETNKTPESELSNEQLDNAAGGFDDFQSFRTLSPAAQESDETVELPVKEDGETEPEGRKAYDLNPNDLSVK